VRLVATFEDGEALFAAVCDRGLEGVASTRERDPYRPRECRWVKTKNQATARFPEEGGPPCSGRSVTSYHHPHEAARHS